MTQLVLDSHVSLGFDAVQLPWDTTRLRTFTVITDNTIEEYGTNNKIPGNQPGEGAPAPEITLDDVLADIVRRFDLPRKKYDTYAPTEPDDGFAGADLTLWRNGKLLAVVRRGADGNPEVIRFDSTDQ